jgi:hypothetical protein
MSMQQINQWLVALGKEGIEVNLFAQGAESFIIIKTKCRRSSARFYRIYLLWQRRIWEK